MAVAGRPSIQTLVATPPSSCQWLSRPRRAVTLAPEAVVAAYDGDGARHA